MKYKIAFSGPSGLGKSTLCKHVTETHGVPWLSTSAGDILTPSDKNYLFEMFGYSGSGHKNVINLSSSNPEFGLQFQSRVLDARIDQIKDNPTFVIDRCPIDNIAYLLTQASHNLSEDVIEGFIKDAQMAYDKLTHVIQIRYSPDIPFIEDNHSRIPNRYFQKYISDVFTGVYSRYFANVPGPQVLTIDFWDLRSRKELVDSFLNSK